MIERIKKSWKAYLLEAVGLMGFVIFAALSTIYLEHPDLPVMNSALRDSPLLRRIPLGMVMGFYIFIITLLFGKKSGAHINPAVTWSYFRLDKIGFWDACLYTAAQFTGAVTAALLLKYSIPDLFGHPIIDFGVSKPKPPYQTTTAFIAEFIISFVMMLAVLLAGSSKRFERYVAVISGILIALFLIFEIPFSGMSLNPARSFAGAFAASEWKHLWVYFLAPPVAMLLATELYKLWATRMLIKKSNDYKGLLVYPASR